ncbi:hypothetical protein EH11_03583 [Bacillus subtilis]|nr:hypothetical protein EH11_03583 [Bacillus subtilis]RUS05524.1 hypothetical protein EFW59_03592 [Bacillus subtilis]
MASAPSAFFLILQKGASFYTDALCQYKNRGMRGFIPSLF